MLSKEASVIRSPSNKAKAYTSLFFIKRDDYWEVRESPIFQVWQFCRRNRAGRSARAIDRSVGFLHVNYHRNQPGFPNLANFESLIRHCVDSIEISSAQHKNL